MVICGWVCGKLKSEWKITYEQVEHTFGPRPSWTVWSSEPTMFLSQTWSLLTTTSSPAVYRASALSAWRSAYREACPATQITPTACFQRRRHLRVMVGSECSPGLHRTALSVASFLLTRQLCGTRFQRPRHTLTFSHSPWGQCWHSVTHWGPQQSALSPLSCCLHSFTFSLSLPRTLPLSGFRCI